MSLSSLRVLITNDDGFNAEGLKILQTTVKTLSREVWTVPPEVEQRASSHSLTLRSPLRIRKVAERAFAVNGTPTDSVLLGVTEIMKACKPDLVLAGINRGGNLG